MYVSSAFINIIVYLSKEFNDRILRKLSEKILMLILLFVSVIYVTVVLKLMNVIMKVENNLKLSSNLCCVLTFTKFTLIQFKRSS